DGSIVAADAVRQNHGGMTGQIGHYKLRAKRRSDDNVHLLEDFDHGVHGHHASAVSLNVLDRRNETCAAEGIRPIVLGLAGEQLVAAAASQVVERSSSFRHHDGGHLLGKEI